jgi:hypothetical protein
MCKVSTCLNNSIRMNIPEITGLPEGEPRTHFVEDLIENRLTYDGVNHGQAVVDLWTNAGRLVNSGEEGSRDDWRNVIRHMVAQSLFAETMAEEMKLDPVKQEILRIAGAIHDWDKRLDFEKSRRIRSEEAMKWEDIRGVLSLLPKGSLRAMEGTTENHIAGTLAFQEGDRIDWMRRLTHWTDNLFQEDEMVGWRERVASERARRADLDTDPRMLGRLEGAQDATYWDAEERLSRETEQHVFEKLQAAGAEVFSPEQVADYIQGKVQDRIAAFAA